MAVFYITQDLMFLSRVAGCGVQRGIDVRGVPNVDELAAAVESVEPRLVLVDLSLPGLDVAALVAAMRSLPGGGPPLVAYAPHVHVAQLDAARQAGCDHVLTRGQFNKQVDGLLEKYGT